MTRHHIMRRAQSLRSKVLLALIVFAGLTALSDFAGAEAPLSGVYTVRQEGNNQFLDAYQANQQDWAVVTRPTQENASQRWIFSNLGGTVYTIQQQSNGRYLDAYLTKENDFAAVTRSAQNNTTQRWIVTARGSGTYRIQQEQTKQYLDAYQDKAKNFRAVTRPYQDNLSQVWSIRRVK